MEYRNGIKLIEIPDVLGRESTYNFYDPRYGESGNSRRKTNTRFFIGLDEQDIFINPEITFIGWEPHEIYAGWRARLSTAGHRGI